MDLVGKTFRNKSTIVYVESVKRSAPDIQGTLYNCICMDKNAFGYSIGHLVHLGKNIRINYPTEVSTNIIFKVKSMLYMNYVACRSNANNTKIVKHSKHIMDASSGLLLCGEYGIDIYPDYIRLQPIDESYWLYGLGNYITKKDYNKIFYRVKKLKKDIDKLWTDVV